MFIYLKQRLDLLGHLAGAGEEEAELVGVRGHDALRGDVHTGVVHRPVGEDRGSEIKTEECATSKQ